MTLTPPQLAAFRTRILLGLAALSTVLPLPASAAFTYLEDGREYHSRHESFEVGESVYVDLYPSPPFSDFTAFPSQLLPNSMTASVSGFDEQAFFSEEDTFSITFSIDQTEAYAMTGSITDDNGFGFDIGPPDPAVDLHRSPFSLTRLSDGAVLFDQTMSQVECGFVDQGTCFAPMVDFDFQGILDPGSYRLFARSTGSGFGAGFSTIDFEFAIVPEPSTSLLLGCGLVGLSAARRRPPRPRSTADSTRTRPGARLDPSI